MPKKIISRVEYQRMEDLTSEEKALVAKIRGLEEFISKSEIKGRFGRDIIKSAQRFFEMAKSYNDEVNKLKSISKNELISQYINEGKNRQKIQSEIKDQLFSRAITTYVETFSSGLAEDIRNHANDSKDEYISSFVGGNFKKNAEELSFVIEAMRFYEANRAVTAETVKERDDIEKEEGIALSEEYLKLQEEYLSMTKFCGNPVTTQNAENYIDNYEKLPQIVGRIGEISKRAEEIRKNVEKPALFTTAGKYQQEYNNNKQKYIEALDSYIDGVENDGAVKAFHASKNVINVEINKIRKEDTALFNELQKQYHVNVMAQKKDLQADYEKALGKINFGKSDSKDTNARIVNALIKEKYDDIHRAVKRDYNKISGYNRDMESDFNKEYESRIKAINSARYYATDYINMFSNGKVNAKEPMENQLNSLSENIERMREFGEKTGKTYDGYDADIKSYNELKNMAEHEIRESLKSPEQKKQEELWRKFNSNKNVIPDFESELDSKQKELAEKFKKFDAESDEKVLLSKWIEINRMYSTGSEKPSIPQSITDIKKIKDLPEDVSEQLKQIDTKYAALEKQYFAFTEKFIDKVYTPKIENYEKALKNIKDGVITDDRITPSKIKSEIDTMFIRSEVHLKEPEGLRKNLYEKYDKFFEELNEKSIAVENRRKKEAEERKEEQARKNREKTKVTFQKELDDAWDKNGKGEIPTYDNFINVRKRLNEINENSLISKEDKEYCNNLFREQVVEPYIEKCMNGDRTSENYGTYIRMLVNAEKVDMTPVNNVWDAIQEGRRKVASSGSKDKSAEKKFVFDVKSKEIFDDLEKVNNTDYGLDPIRWGNYKVERGSRMQRPELQMILGMNADKIASASAMVDRLVSVKLKCDYLYQPEEIEVKGKKQTIQGKPRVEVLKADFDKKSPSFKNYEKDCKALDKLNKQFEKSRDSFLKGKADLKTLESKYEEISKLQKKIEEYDLVSAKEKKYPKISSLDSKNIDSKGLKDLYKGLDNKIRDFYSVGNVDRKQIVEEVEKGISRLDMLGIKGKDYDDYKDFVDCYYADERRKGLANDFETFAKEDIKKEKMNFDELKAEMEKYEGFKAPKKGVTKKDVSAVKDALIRENAYAR